MDTESVTLTARSFCCRSMCLQMLARKVPKSSFTRAETACSVLMLRPLAARLWGILRYRIFYVGLPVLTVKGAAIYRRYTQKTHGTQEWRRPSPATFYVTLPSSNKRRFNSILSHLPRPDATLYFCGMHATYRLRENPKYEVTWEDNFITHY